jgi:hypothetical protein
MSRIILFLVSILSFIILLVSCNNKPTLQKYLVENSEKKDFIAIDVAPSILKVDAQKLTADEKKAIESFDNMNIIAFQANDKNQAEYVVEKNKVSEILKDKKYQELMRVGSGNDGASISFVGEDDKIDEFVLFANKKENGFAVVRIVGDNMNPADLMSFLSLLKKSNIDMAQFKPLEGLIK